MNTTFHCLPERSAAAAGNMAGDFMLLQRYPQEAHIRFRNYSWHRPAFTFGYSQKLAFVRAQLPTGENPELCRRPTGGGVVDHREDWTYALVLPRGHAAYDARAVESYRLIHQGLAEALRAQGEEVEIKTHCEPAAEGTTPCGPGVCFTRAELYDVIRRSGGAKVAGAAQKRNKHGLLFQGSIARRAVSPTLDWERFRTDFIDQLAQALHATSTDVGWPDWSEEEYDGLVEQYSSPDWNEFR